MLRKLLLTIIIAAVSLCASAELRWGPTAGINISDYYFKQDLITTSQSLGPNAGLMTEIMFPGIGFGIDFGLIYQMHGAKLNFGMKEVWAADGYGNEQLWMHTLRIPLNLRFKYTRLQGLEDYVAPFAFAGPVFSISLAHSDLKALNYPAGHVGVQVGLGAEILKNFQVSGAYYWGLTYEIRTNKLDNFSARPRGWQVNLTYLFKTY